MEYSALKALVKSKKIVIVHHMDVDGTCSASQMLKHIEADTYALKDPHLYPEFLDYLQRKKPESVFFVDLSIDQEWKGLIDLQGMLKKTKFCIIDHHKITRDMNKYGFIHINPRFEKEDAYVPASLMVFNILEGLEFDNEKDRWISAIGTISDFGHKSNPEFIEGCKKSYPELMKGKDIFKTSLGDASKTVYSAIISSGMQGLNHVLDVFKKSTNFETFQKDKKLKEWRQEIDSEIENVLIHFEKNKVIDGKLIFYEVKSNYGITSIISNYITERYPNYVIVITKNDNEGWKLSIRSPKLKFNLSEIIPRCVEGIGRGGGHEKAAGGFVTDIEKFRERLSSEINKN